MPATANNPMVYMRGQLTVDRPLLSIDGAATDNRIADRYAEARRHADLPPFEVSHNSEASPTSSGSRTGMDSRPLKSPLQ